MKKSQFRLGLILILSLSLMFSCTTKNTVESEQATVKAFDYVREGEVVKGVATGADEVTIAIAATSDVHGRIYPYEYAIDSEDNDAGFSMTYPFVEQIREEYPNALVIDVGDTVQDNSAELFNDMDIHPMVECMNMMEYDVWVPGNHEFNFGLPFLERNLEAFEGRVVCANIKNVADGSDYVLPYQIFDIEGVKVAVIGGVAPHVPQWEASAPEHFQGLDFVSPLQATKDAVAAIGDSADVIVAAMHMSRNGQYEEENISGAYQLAEEIPELDLIIAGHEHATYCEKVNDTYVMEPGRYGNKVAFSTINLVKVDGEWTIEDVQAENLVTKGADASKEVLEEFKWVHDKSVENANTVIGEITSDFLPEGVDYITGDSNVTTMPRTQIEDTAVIDLINTVQKKYANAEVSSAALFNFGSTLNKGDFKKKDVAFIYKYNNTLMGVNITGQNLLDYMEWSVSYYNTYHDGDVTISFNPDVRGYNYDMFAGVDYKVDISKEAGSRIVNPTINGEAIDPSRVYKLAVNNYRFGTLSSHGWVDETDVYYDSYNEDQLNAEVRALIAKYVQEELDGVLAPTCDNNWELVGMGDSFNEAEVIQMIKSGDIVIPASEDGRTLNVKAVNVNEI
ncbi:MAG: bifunctional metallophosphatase/5'-nucleotidase [Pleomorphochaeta sp.]